MSHTCKLEMLRYPDESSFFDTAVCGVCGQGFKRVPKPRRMTLSRVMEPFIRKAFFT